MLNDSGLLVSGRFADLYGRKLLFIGGLCLGLVANIVSGFVPASPSYITRQLMNRTGSDYV